MKANKKLTFKAVKIIRILRKATKNLRPPMITSIKDKYGQEPFLILISCLLSLRTRDIVTLPICIKLFSEAKTPQEFLKIPVNQIQNIIRPINYYKRKSYLIHEISREIISKFNGQVPNNLEDLLSMKGIGNKTANLVLCEAFNISAIYVDTHVHRISNKLGLVNTKNAIQTEKELKKIVPKQYWCDWSNLLVTWGQNGCLSIAPYVSDSILSELCKNWK